MIIRLAHTDGGEYELQDVPVFDPETGEQTGTEQQEVCIRQPYTVEDVKKILPHWNGGRHTQRLTIHNDEYVFGNSPHVSGARIDILDAGKRVIKEAEYDAEGNVTEEAVYADELRYDIYVPDNFPLPHLMTQVTPNSPDRGYVNNPPERLLDTPDENWDVEEISMWAQIRNIPVSEELTAEELLQAILDYFEGKSGVKLWQVGVWLKKDAEVIYDGIWYKVNMGHHTQADWPPDITPALFTEIPAPGEIDQWTQPTGAHDAYPLGHIVSHNDKLWQSNHPANVWEPGTGNLWTLLTEEDEGIPDWVQPQGAHDAYMAGDEVMHNGQHWISDIDNNVWAPGVYGWSLVE